MSLWAAPWKQLQRSLFDEPEPPPAAAVPAPPAALNPPPTPAPRETLSGEVFRHPRAQRDVRLDGHTVAYEMRRARRRSIGFVVGPEGNTSELVNYRVRGNYMVVDRLFAAAELRFGAGDHQKRVRITRTDGRPAS